MKSKIKRLMLPVLAIPVLALLAGCSGLNAVGVRPDQLPNNVSEPCDDPLTVIKSVRGNSVGSDELRMGRLGDALIECSKEKAVAVHAYDEIRIILTGSKT